MHETGLKCFFGPLEAKVMEVLWNRETSFTIKEVQQTLQKEKATKFNTVMTVMNRLVDKGILEKRIEGRSSLFKPVQTRNEFLNTQSQEMAYILTRQFGHTIVGHMIDTLHEADETLIRQMERKINEWKNVE